MIFGQIDKVIEFDSCSSTILKCLNAIKFICSESFKLGKFEIDDDFFGIGMEYISKEEENGIWESHRSYVDIHIVYNGIERVLINDIQDMTSTKDYDSDLDFELFEGKKKQELILKTSDILILYPNEVHKTGVIIDDKLEVKKYVFKLRI